MAHDAEGTTIRAARPGDRPVLERFMAALQDFERAIEPNRRPGHEMARAHLGALLAWASEHPAGGVRLAETAEGPAGFVLWGVETEFGDYVLPENRTYGRISELWVEPRARRTGLARRLIAAAEARLAVHGIHRVEIGAVAANAQAIATYEALGYAPSSLFLSKRLG